MSDINNSQVSDKNLDSSPKLDDKKTILENEKTTKSSSKFEKIIPPKIHKVIFFKNLNPKKVLTLAGVVLASLTLIWLVASGVLYMISGSQIFFPERSYNIEIPGTQRYFIKNDKNQNLEVLVKGDLKPEVQYGTYPMPIMQDNLSAISDSQQDDINQRESVAQRNRINRERGVRTVKQTFVLYLHGNSGRLPHFFYQIEQFRLEKNIPITIVSPSYPGFGLSEGQTTVENTYETGLKTYDWLIDKGVSPDQIIVFGHSMGGSPAVYLASQKSQIQKLVIVNTFSSVASMCFRQYSILCTFSTGLFNTAENAKKVEAKVRQFAYTGDDTVPFAEGEKLSTYFTKTKDKKFTTLSGDTHSYFDMKKVMED